MPRQSDGATEVITGHMDSAACRTVGPCEIAAASPAENAKAVMYNGNYKLHGGKWNEHYELQAEKREKAPQEMAPGSTCPLRLWTETSY